VFLSRKYGQRSIVLAITDEGEVTTTGNKFEEGWE
jgi:hypothetical protein